MTDCAAPRHGGQDEPTPAETSAYLCRPCRSGLTRDLNRLPGLHRDLDALGTQSGHGDGQGLPFNDAASECRSQIRYDLTWWAMRITQERGTTAPLPAAGDGWAANPVPALCAWLAPQTGWVSFRPWAGDMAGAIADNRHRAIAILDPQIRKHIDLGPCLDCETGRMQATVYASEGDKRRSFVACAACGARWEMQHWMRLGHRIDQRREQATAL